MLSFSPAISSFSNLSDHHHHLHLRRYNHNSVYTAYTTKCSYLTLSNQQNPLQKVRAQQGKDEPYVGVNIGTDVSNLLPPAKLVSFLQQQKVTHIRIYDSDPEILKALSKTKIRVIISVPNNQILGIGSSNTTAANWINKNVMAFYPDTLITTVAVGAEVLTTVPSLSSMLMLNLDLSI